MATFCDLHGALAPNNHEIKHLPCCLRETVWVDIGTISASLMEWSRVAKQSKEEEKKCRAHGLEPVPLKPVN